MKKYQKLSTLLLASFMVIAFMFIPGNTASAEEDCGCGKMVYGAEKNKVIADMLNSDAFKTKKQELQDEGYQWDGVANFEVNYNNDFGAYLVILPIVNENGDLTYFLYGFGGFVGPIPAS